MRLVNRALSVCSTVALSVYLSACPSVSLFVCLYALIYFIWKWCSLLPSPTEWVDHLGRNLRATNETRTTRFPCVAATSTHPLLHPIHTYIISHSLRQSVERSFCGFQLFLYHFCLAHYAALCRQMNPCTLVWGERLQKIFTVHNFQVFIFIVYLKLLHDIFNFPLSLSLSLPRSLLIFA